MEADALILLDNLLDTGLLQFGLFGEAPLRLNLHMLPAYPDVLTQIVAHGTDMVDTRRYERLVAPADAVPLGVALSMSSGIPLVYSRGSDAPPVHDLVGAYDVGHPALLVANVWDASLPGLIAGAKRVGLEIDAALLVIDFYQHDTTIEHHALLNLAEAVTQLAADGRIPAGQAQLVQSWITKKDTIL